jgi:hypothetical protein
MNNGTKIEATGPIQRMSKNTKLVDTAPPDPRLIIEKGGYRPDVGGRTLPPGRRPSKPSGAGAGSER